MRPVFNLAKEIDTMVYVDADRMLQTMVPGCLGVVKSPRAFFRQLPASPLYRDSIMVLSFVSLLSVVVSVLFHAEAMLFLYPLVWVLMLITLKLFELYLSRTVRGANGRPLAGCNAFRILTYASVPLALMFVPWLTLAAQFWALYLLWMGLVERVKVPSTVAAMAVFIPGLVMMAIGNIGWMLILAKVPQLDAWL